MKTTILSTLMYASLESLASLKLHAADFQFQNIRPGGTGCPTEQTQVVLAPDGSSASIIFSQFESRVPVETNNPKIPRNISNLNCNMFVDIKIPAGIKLESLEVSYDMRGFAILDRGVNGSFKSFLVSKTGLGLENAGRSIETIHQKLWSNTSINQEEDFTISATKKVLMPSSCARSGSGDIVTLRLQHTLESKILSGFENLSQGSITMDTSDLTGGLKLKAVTSRCGNTPPSNPPHNGGGSPSVPPIPPSRLITEQCQVRRFDPAGFFIQSYIASHTGIAGTDVRGEACRKALNSCSLNIKGRQTCRIQ